MHWTKRNWISLFMGIAALATVVRAGAEIQGSSKETVVTTAPTQGSTTETVVTTGVQEKGTSAETSESAGAKQGDSAQEVHSMSKIYEFSANSLDGKPIKLEQYAGKVMLIVNTASKCGFTPQYKGLQKLYEELHPAGLEVLGFPCNQFGSQEPGDHSEIGAFCEKNYGVTFQMFDKIDVNGDKADPIYKYLEEAAPGALGTKGIKWNFTKFLVDKDGKVLRRYAPNVEPDDIKEDIVKLLEPAKTL